MMTNQNQIRVEMLDGYLSNLRRLHEGGFHCPREIAECVTALREELQLKRNEDAENSDDIKIVVRLTEDKAIADALAKELARYVDVFSKRRGVASVNFVRK